MQDQDRDMQPLGQRSECGNHRPHGRIVVFLGVMQLGQGVAHQQIGAAFNAKRFQFLHGGGRRDPARVHVALKQGANLFRPAPDDVRHDGARALLGGHQGSAVSALLFFLIVFGVVIHHLQGLDWLKRPQGLARCGADCPGHGDAGLAACALAGKD